MTENHSEERKQIAVELRRMEERYASAPTLEQMTRRTLTEKGINGPTAAHAVEEVHVPLNVAFLTFTTGSSAIQTPVCVLPEELERRKAAGRMALQLAGIAAGEDLLVTYPPLVNVFSSACLTEAGVSCHFLRRSCKESLVASLVEEKGNAVIGESSFLRSALEDCIRMGIRRRLPERMILLAAGTPLDPELPELLRKFPGWDLHDLYGCQEFGWLALDGVPLREDLLLLTSPEEPDVVWPVVGGIPVGDCFRRGTHRLNPGGRLVTHAKISARTEWETWVLSAPVQEMTLRRTAKSILRTKSRVVHIDPDVSCGADSLRVLVSPCGDRMKGVLLEREEQLHLLQNLIEAQKQYQKNQKRDGAWNKHESLEQT